MSEAVKESAEDPRMRMIQAAITVVGRHGYAKASMARIAEEAGVAYGSIYLHFQNQRDLFLHLLPEVGEALRRAIRARTKEARTFLEHETIGFDVLCEIASERPAQRRVMMEAAFFVPEAYDAYLERMAAAYVRTMKACQERGDLGSIAEADFEAIAFSLMGAKQFLLGKYLPARARPKTMPTDVRQAYLAFVERALAGGNSRIA